MKSICRVLLVVAGMALLVDAAAAEEIKTRVYPVSEDAWNRFVDAAEHAGLHSDDCDRNICGLLRLFGVDWPEESGIEYARTLGGFNVRNTSENL